MSGYKIIMIILEILSVMISFGALVALICLEPFVSSEIR